MKKQLLICLLCGLLALSAVCLPACGDKEKPEDKLPVMPLDIALEFSDHARDLILSDLTGYRHTKYGASLYEFPLSDARFSVWICYNAELGMLDYMMVTSNLTDEKLYVYCRDAASLAESEHYAGPTDSKGVKEFMNKEIKDKK